MGDDYYRMKDPGAYTSKKALAPPPKLTEGLVKKALKKAGHTQGSLGLKAGFIVKKEKSIPGTKKGAVIVRHEDPQGSLSLDAMKAQISRYERDLRERWGVTLSFFGDSLSLSTFEPL